MVECISIYFTLTVYAVSECIINYYKQINFKSSSV